MISTTTIPNRRHGEEIVTHLRRHWLVFVMTALLYIGLAVLPPLVALAATALQADLAIVLTYPVIGPGLVVLIASYYLLLIVFGFTAWTEMYLDTWTITTERIINSEQNGLFNRVVSELDLSDIQDVTGEEVGFLPTIFHYGNVYIQTAAERERFLFEEIPGPYRIAKIIQRLHETAKNADLDRG